jgi:cardiolipin synthase
MAQIRLGNALASTAASSGNLVRVLVDAADTYHEMMQAIENATSYVHVEFYIIRSDTVGVALRDGLVKLAQSGVSVRVICDSVGSVDLPSEFWKPLRDAGGNTAFFAPLTKLHLRLRRRDRVDFRNHRKIVIVDGRVGFTGGINVGKEYLGLDPNVGRWRDTHVRIEGPAVLSLQQAFVHDWLLTTGETLDDGLFFEMGPEVGDCPVQVIDSGPDRTWASMELYYAQAIALAQNRVWITNPYFIPSQTIESMLVQAALRGVDVRLLLPKKSDSFLVTWASHSYYRYLLFAGVRIFEYDRGFVHAKTMVVDDWVATIGSANMDLRSFKLNFELNAFLFDGEICRTLASQFETDLDRAREVTKAMERRISIGRRLLRGIARLTSPLL